MSEVQKALDALNRALVYEDGCVGMGMFIWDYRFLLKDLLEKELRSVTITEFDD